MSNVSITLKPHQIYVLPHEYTNDVVTITGPASSSVVLAGNLDLDASTSQPLYDRSFSIVGPQLVGQGKIDLGTGQHVELGKVNDDITIKLTTDDTLLLDKPTEFLGTVADLGNSGFAFPPPAPVTTNNSIDIPSIVGFDHATFKHGLLKVFNAQDQLLDQLKLPGVDHVTIDYPVPPGTGGPPFGPASGIDILTGVRPDMNTVTVPHPLA